jgi:hypothetical protein
MKGYPYMNLQSYFTNVIPPPKKKLWNIMKCSKDKKSLNKKMPCFVTSIPHVGNNHIIKENVSLLQAFHRETLMYGEET